MASALGQAQAGGCAQDGWTPCPGSSGPATTRERAMVEPGCKRGLGGLGPRDFWRASSGSGEPAASRPQKPCPSRGQWAKLHPDASIEARKARLVDFSQMGPVTWPGPHPAGGVAAARCTRCPTIQQAAKLMQPSFAEGFNVADARLGMLRVLAAGAILRLFWPQAQPVNCLLSSAAGVWWINCPARVGPPTKSAWSPAAPGRHPPASTGTGSSAGCR